MTGGSKNTARTVQTQQDGYMCAWTDRRLWQHSQGLHTFKPDAAPAVPGRSGPRTHLQLTIAYKGKKLTFSTRVSLDINTTQSRLMLAVDDQQKMTFFFLVLFVLQFFLWTVLFLILLVFCIYVFQFCASMGFVSCIFLVFFLNCISFAYLFSIERERKGIELGG